jgi:hypothetical protein
VAARRSADRSRHPGSISAHCGGTARLATRWNLSEAEREWRRLFLKVFANGTAYGIQAEMNRQEGRSSWIKAYIGDGSFHTRAGSPERPGAYAFPPAPAFIAALLG